MPKKKCVLSFPPGLTEQPLTYHLVKEFDLAINILQARVTPGEAGKMVVELSNGTMANIEAGINFLIQKGVAVESVSTEIILNEAECINCGSCTAVCRPEALTIVPPDWKLSFDQEKCIVCQMCVKACPMRIIKVSF